MRTFDEICQLIGAFRPSAGFIRVPDRRLSDFRARLGEPTTVRRSDRHVVIAYPTVEGAAMIIGKCAATGEHAVDNLVTEGWIVRT